MPVRIFPSSVATGAGRTLAEKNTSSILGYIMDHRAVKQGFQFVSNTSTTVTVGAGEMLFDGYQVELTDSVAVGFYDTIYDADVSAPVVGDTYYLVCFLKFQDNNNEFLQTVVDETSTGENILRILPANFYTAYLENKLDYVFGGYIYRAQAIYTFTYAASMVSDDFVDIRNFLRFDLQTISTGWFENLEFITSDGSFSTEFTKQNATDPAVFYDMAALLTKKGAGQHDLMSFLYDYIDFIQTGIRGLPSLKRGSKTFAQQYDSYVTYDSNQNRDDCLPITTEVYGDVASPSIYNKLRYNVVSGATTIRGYDFINAHIKYSGDTGAVVGDLVTLDSTATINAIYLPKASDSIFGVVKINTAVKDATSDAGIFSIASGVLSCNAARYAFKTIAVSLFDYAGSQSGATVSVVAAANNATLSLNYGSGLSVTPDASSKTILVDVDKTLNIDTVLLQNGGVLDTTGNKGVAIRFNSQANNATILNPSFMFVKNTSGTDSYIQAISMLRDSSIDLIQLGNISTPLNIKAIDTLNLFCSNSGTSSTTVKATLTSTALTTFVDLVVGTDGANKNITLKGDLHATGHVFDAAWNDYAELFEKEDVNEHLEPGDVIAVSKHGKGYGKADCENAKLCVGVYSDSFGPIVGGDPELTLEENLKNYIPVGLTGRVNVKVMGPVMCGDLLGASLIPGVATKIIGDPTGIVIGKALETKDSLGVERISMLIMLG